MQVVPVLDVKGGSVVRGVMGDRANYRPIETPLSNTAEPLAVARGLLSLHSFGALYVADLDAIEGVVVEGVLEEGAGRRRRGEPDEALMADLVAAHPGIALWLDAGVASFDEAMAIDALPGVLCVVGSESVDGPATVGRLSEATDFALSLDFRGEAFLGPREILDDAGLWPDRLIVMTLAKVGSGAGPDFDRLEAIRARAGDRDVFAAGGVRGPEDLRRLAAMGISGALVASALHDGRIAAADLSALPG
ncbi:HisA/HisF-related TIM barrel protein [Jiella sonneratiae]|uniref:Nickel transporter n=1 Tax=Jiella sonneratiae TaxID=2816856 RepID=A0ABS3J1F6_9HYPH|nr:HisA/HisF-related TIM barrel protein [Jiella sonneratiae]MBO0903492.1 nickel transporter [Jiella sonneratiae]